MLESILDCIENLASLVILLNNIKYIQLKTNFNDDTIIAQMPNYTTIDSNIRFPLKKNQNKISNDSTIKHSYHHKYYVILICFQLSIINSLSF
jgi:hypothetical protein